MRDDMLPPKRPKTMNICVYTGLPLQPVFSLLAEFCQIKNVEFKTEVDHTDSLSTLLNGIEFPLIVDRETAVPYIYSGISTCLRRIVQIADQKFHYLLGHKGYALKGLAEASPRTNLVDNLLPEILSEVEGTEKYLEALKTGSGILEQLLAQPSRIHNRDKLQRILLARNKDVVVKHGAQTNKETPTGDESWSTIRKMGGNIGSVKSEDLSLLLKAFTEGAIMSVMDLACYGFLQKVEFCNDKYPFVSRWMRIMKSIMGISHKQIDLTHTKTEVSPMPNTTKQTSIFTISPESSDHFLLPSDPPIDICLSTGEVRVIQNESDYPLKTLNPIVAGDLNITPGNLGKRKKRKLQSEEEKSKCLTTRRDLPILIESLAEKRYCEFYDEIENLDQPWEKLAKLNDHLQPAGGELKGKRLSNKIGQIESMSQCIEKLIDVQNKNGTGNKITLVDFCAGCGHSSLPLAELYPENLQVIILENKNQSLMRAFHRAEKANLKNVICLQANLEMYHGKFDLGIALHACGPATDMVLKKCFNVDADFVIVPCCYGRIATLATTSDLISAENFPKSEKLRKEVGISRDEFHLISQAADMDQAVKAKIENLQEAARRCMRIVDWDRLISIKEQKPRYGVSLKRMFPVNCATKNHILVGEMSKEK
jgi:hypothetical protein